MQRSKFYSRLRKPGENVSSYVAELHALADHCSFGNSLDTMIRDRLVCGINEDIVYWEIFEAQNFRGLVMLKFFANKFLKMAI